MNVDLCIDRGFHEFAEWTRPNYPDPSTRTCRVCDLCHTYGIPSLPSLYDQAQR
jgi:hypothetical protein